MPQLILVPQRLDRTTAEDKLDYTSTARVMQAIDCATTPGRMRRASGYKRTQAQASNTIPLGVGVFTKRDCGKIVMYENANGDVYSQPGDGSAFCAGPLDDWNGHGSPAT